MIKRLFFATTVAAVVLISAFGHVQAQQKSRISVDIFQHTSADGGALSQRPTGIGVEYYREINRWWGISGILSHARYSNIPRDPDAYLNSYAKADPMSARSTDETASSVSNHTFNKSTLSAQLYFTPIRNEKHLVYISNGIGYKIQDYTYQTVSNVYSYPQGEAGVQPGGTIVYATRNSRSAVYLLYVGYDRKLSNHWFVGTYLHGGLPIGRVRYEATRGITSGPDHEVLGLGIKVGKYF